MSLLVVERGLNSGDRIPLVEFPVLIGRDPTNNIVVNDQECSRKHLRIKKRGRLIIVEDLESHNGTFVNGDRIINAVLRNGDRILIGSTELRFVTSFPEVQLATEIVKYDMLVADELGIEGPIDVTDVSANRKLKPWRLSKFNPANAPQLDNKAIRKLIDFHTDIMVADDLDEAARMLLKAIGQIIPSVSRSAFFLWRSANKQLVPIAVRHSGKKQHFLLSQRCMEDVLARKQAILLQEGSSPQVTHSGRNRVIFPIVYHNEPICLIHAEIDNTAITFQPDQLELIQAVLNRASSNFEAMMLRRELDVWFAGMLETMVAIVEAKDTYTRGHSERVSRYCMAIAEEMKLDKEVKRLLMMSAIVHDIGKIGIPDSILKKASLLSGDEYEEMKLHPTIGAEILRNMPQVERFISGVKHHHEKWDGSGYPDGLAGEDIPFFGRIVGIADAYDAMVSGRSYSGFIDQTEAVERLTKEKNKFDPEITKAFLRSAESGMLTLKTDTQNNNPEEDLNSKKVTSHKKTNIKSKK